MFEMPSMNKESSLDLKRISDGASRHIQALKALKRPTDSWDDHLIYLLTSKLDATIIRDWRKSQATDSFPTLKEFLIFLSHQCQVLEATQKHPDALIKYTNTRSHTNSKFKSSCGAVSKAKCHLCAGDHFLYQCKQFISLPISERINKARSVKVCLNCLRSTAHVASKCPSGNCRLCTHKHNTILHVVPSINKTNLPTPDATPPQRSSDTSDIMSSHSANINMSRGVLLSTAVLLVESKGGTLIPGRVLLDSGSQPNFIASEYLNSLNLLPHSVNVSIFGIGAKEITNNLPNLTLKRANFQIPPNIKLADPNFNVSAKVDILLGAEIFWDLICVGQIKANAAHPTLQKTRLGWILLGSLVDSERGLQHFHSLYALISNNELNKQLEKFWRLEDIADNFSHYTKQERECERHFQNTTSRNTSGRYVVQFPFREDIITKLGHMRLINKSSSNFTQNYYLPHHAVFKEGNKTSKIRVVFDASSLTDTGVSLNDTLLRILWRESPNSEVQEFELTTMTYGTASASYLVTRCLLDLADTCKKIFPVGLRHLKHSFYVDDLLAGGNTPGDIILIRDQVSQLLRSGCFELDKWRSNCKGSLTDIASTTEEPLTFNKPEDARILGLAWNTKGDIFQFPCTYSTSSSSITKRLIVSKTSKLFDPLGLLGPILVVAKLMIQALWNYKIDWDESVPQNVNTEWTHFTKELNNLNQFRIPR
ncbi:uncharacterized protein [Cardiocondyla obscurior]|uniref:uncharacterized protein n=1 Tax=Cardiocondyla obscurior TaxID=286306 RepID=UPI0039657EB7